MDIITKIQRYLPHTLDTRYHAVKLYRGGSAVFFVCRRYKLSKVLLMRWNERFDGTKESLMDLSHKPRTKHPSSHTDEEVQHIRNYIQRKSKITMLELYARLKFDKDYKKHLVSLFRMIRKLEYFKDRVKQKKIYSKAL